MTNSGHGRMRPRLWLLAILAVAVAVVAGIMPPGSAAKYRGRTLHAWLHPPIRPFRHDYSPSQARADSLAFQTNAALAFQEAGPTGLRFLLGELQAPESRSDWVRHDLVSGLARHGWIQRPFEEILRDNPGMRSRAAFELIGYLPPLPDESFRVLTNEFGGLALALDHAGAPAVGLARPRFTIGPDAWGIYEARLNRLSVLAGWISRNGNRGQNFLTNQMFTSTSTTTQGAILSAFAGAETHTPATVAAVVQAARNPELAFMAAQLLTGLREEPAVAIPGLVQSLNKAGVNIISLSLLGEWGTNAVPWLPAILPLTTNADPQVSFQAEIAVRKLRGNP